MNPITSPGLIYEKLNDLKIENDGSININLQNQTTKNLVYFLIDEEKTDIKLSETTQPGLSYVNVSADHGFETGKDIVIQDENNIFQALVTNVETNKISLCYPVDNVFTTNATVIRGSRILKINGSNTAKEFKFKSRVNTAYDVTTVNLAITHSAAGDLSKFGSITALTNGIYFELNNTIEQNLFNVKQNLHFYLYGFEIEFTDKAGGGKYGTLVKKEFSQTGNTQCIRIHKNDEFKLIVRDDLSTLDSFFCTIIGHQIS